MRLPLWFYAVLLFVALISALGALGATAIFLSGTIGVALFPNLNFEQAMIAGVVIAVPAAIYLQFRIMRASRRWFDKLERRRAVRSVVEFEDVMPPYTLYLRAFADDTLQSARTRTSPVGMLTSNRYETMLIAALSPIGPVVAVGAPGEELPHSGARRLYLDHTVWQERVRTLMQHARAIVIVIGETEGVWWEIETVLENANPARVALVFPTGVPSDTVGSGFYRADRVPAPRTHANLLQRLDAIFEQNGLGKVPRPRRRDHILVIDPARGPTFLRTRMTMAYYALLTNPVIWLAGLIAWLVPSLPWRMSLAGEVAYKPSFAPFIKSIRSIDA